MIKVFDDVIPKNYQKKIEDLFFSRDYPWYYVHDVTYGNMDWDGLQDFPPRPAFSHIHKEENQVLSQYMGFLTPLLMQSCDRADVEYNDVLKMRSFLQYPLAEQIRTDKLDPMHIDLWEPHTVVLYYVIDSDGDTLIYDKVFDKSKGDNTYYGDFDEVTEIARVTPKQGRVVVFNGHHYHTAEQPMLNRRCVINANII